MHKYSTTQVSINTVNRIFKIYLYTFENTNAGLFSASITRSKHWLGPQRPTEGERQQLMLQIVSVGLKLH